jgi:hypothetical protein
MVRTSDWHADDPVGRTIVDAIATYENTRSSELPALERSINPDALDYLFESTGDGFVEITEQDETDLPSGQQTLIADGGQVEDGTERFVIVGCGSAKQPRELEPGKLRVKRYPLRDLYTSTYFQKKREYAETFADQWCILSALHGLRDPSERFEPYDVSIDDLSDDQLDGLAHRIGMVLIEWIEWETTPVEEIVVLAGKKYLDPLRERDTFSAGIEALVTFPLQNDLGGIGEQMAWLKERVEAQQHEQTVQIDPSTVEGDDE